MKSTGAAVKAAVAEPKIVVVGSKPPGLASYRDNPLFLFVDYAADAFGEISIPESIRFIILGPRVTIFEKEQVETKIGEYRCKAELIRVNGSNTFAGFIENAKNRLSGPSRVVVDYVNNKTSAQLSSQLPEGVVCEEGGIYAIPTHLIARYPDQPRKNYDPAKDEDLPILARSIQVAKQVVAGIVIRVEDLPPGFYSIAPGVRFMLVDGERRWNGCKLAGKPFRATITRVLNSAWHHVESAVANFGRKEHSPMETAYALQKTRDDLNMGEQALADLFCQPVKWVRYYLDFLKLSPVVQDLVGDGSGKTVPNKLKPAIAQVLTSLPFDLQERLAKEVLAKRMNSSRAKNYIRQQAASKGHIAGSKTRSPAEDYRSLQRYLKIVRESGAMMFNLPQLKFSEMFRFRNPADAPAILATIKGCTGLLGKLAAKIEEATKLENKY